MLLQLYNFSLIIYSVPIVGKTVPVEFISYLQCCIGQMMGKGLIDARIINHDFWISLAKKFNSQGFNDNRKLVINAMPFF